MKKTYKQDTKLVHVGRAPEEYFGLLNAPPASASSIIYPSLAAYESTTHKYRYGRMGTPLAKKFEEAVTMLEGGYAAVSAPSGMTAISIAVMAFVKAGDHILVTDSLYESSRCFFDGFVTRMGMKVEYYDPLIGTGISKLIKKNTALIYLESPGSATFEVQDIPAITKIARKHKIVTIFDNSWGSGLLFNAFEHGVDVSVIAATKYMNGHADAMLGAVVAGNKETYKKIKSTALDLGICAGTQEMYLALRGLRTMKLRLKQSAENAMVVAKWLNKHPKVQKVYYPALPTHSSHKLWRRDFKGANGLLSILLKPAPKSSVARFMKDLELFPMAASWGGYESLLLPQYPEKRALPWKEKGFLVRLHIGLEDPDDLIADLKQALQKFK